MNVYDSILIVGDRGMLASAVKRSLDARKLRYAGVDKAECDITDAAQVTRLFDQFKPTLVLNCAAFTNVDGCEKTPDIANAVNGSAPLHLAGECKRLAAKLVHISTDYVFDGTLRRPLVPSDPIGPQSAYGKSKLLGEKNIQEVNPPGWIIIRTAWLYGPNGPNFPQTMLNAQKAGKQLRVVSDQIGSPTFTYDLADAMLALIDHNAQGIWHLSNSGQTNWADFARAVFDEFGVQTTVESISSADWTKIKPDSAIRPAYSVLDTSAFQKLTGKPMPAWREALSRFHRAIG